jgi:hypothetical protein
VTVIKDSAKHVISFLRKHRAVNVRITIERCQGVTTQNDAREILKLFEKPNVEITRRIESVIRKVGRLGLSHILTNVDKCTKWTN